MTDATGPGVPRSSPSVLLVAGEASGDRMAARIARTLHGVGVHCIGMGGPACRAAGVELVADLRRSAAMGLTEVAARLPAVATAFWRVVRAARDARPEAAVLVDYTEFNLRMGALLKARGVPVLWCVAPQVWAWRPRRMEQVARALDRLAVILPFEAPLWRAQGVDAHYVGHPVLDAPAVDRATARARLGLSTLRPSVAILPGSRPHEVRRHTVPMLAALKELDSAGMGVEARLLVAASLDIKTRRWLAAKGGEGGVRSVDVDADAGTAAYLGAFDAALTASGTATLECALAGAPPVVVYRLSPLTAAIARRIVRTPFVALPNIVLGSGVYPELLDRDVEPRRMARALGTVLERRSTFEPFAHELRARLSWQRPSPDDPLAVPTGETSAERVASLLSGWLPLGSRAPSGEPRAMTRAALHAPGASLPP
ncbi:MAG TPA: lipid-A-disaccharide synthase [Polyangiaceae bacterium]|nr:lipid-A-disaccharide synthase [Polyangiaceae bacterium]